MLDRRSLPPILQRELKRSESYWVWRFSNIVIPFVATVTAWLWLVWIFGGFN